jgi:acetyltransferase-like isoleucine patch superfamily enzyme
MAAWRGYTRASVRSSSAVASQADHGDHGPETMIDATARIHATADLEPDVHVGPRTSVWHRAQVRTGARIGADCVIGRDAFVDEGVVMGDRVKVQNLALVYHGVTVEDGVFIGPNAILTNDRYPRAITATGALARAEDWTVSPIALRTGCSIGAGAVVVAGTVIGRFATVGAGSVVTRDVPDHALVVGSPARRIGWVCACGGRLHVARGRSMPPDAVSAPADADGPAACPSCGARYAISGDSCVAAS